MPGVMTDFIEHGKYGDENKFQRKRLILHIGVFYASKISKWPNISPSLLTIYAD